MEWTNCCPPLSLSVSLPLSICPFSVCPSLPVSSFVCLTPCCLSSNRPPLCLQRPRSVVSLGPRRLVGWGRVCISVAIVVSISLFSCPDRDRFPSLLIIPPSSPAQRKTSTISPVIHLTSSPCQGPALSPTLHSLYLALHHTLPLPLSLPSLIRRPQSLLLNYTTYILPNPMRPATIIL